MKILLYIILQFVVFGSFAQLALSPGLVDENDTLKRIKLNGKVGLIHQNGSIVLEPKYTNVLIHQWGILFFENGLQGFLPNDADKAIPVNYKAIDKVYSFYTAKTENGTIDLYNGSELIANDLDPGLSETDVLLETGLIIVRKDDKSGLINEKGEIVVPFEYSVIERLPAFKYELDDKVSVDYMLVLDQTEYFYSPESGGSLPFDESRYYFAKANGSLITDSVFSTFWPVNPEKNTLSLMHGKKIATLHSDFQVVYSPYETEEEFLEWKFCNTGKEEIIFNRYGQAIDSFAAVMIPYKMSVGQNRQDLETTSYEEMLFEDFVYVQKSVNESNLTAIYDLKNQKIVSDFQKSITFVRRGFNPSGSVIWIYKDEVDLLAYTISINGKSSAFEYQDIYQVSQQFYAFKKAGETDYKLCELIGDSVFIERLPIEKTFGSLNYQGLNTKSVQEYDPDLGGGFVDDFGNYSSFSLNDEPEVVSPFSIPFTIFKNRGGKLGFISWNGKVIDLNADTLFQSSKSTSLLEYRTGNLWGAAHIAWGIAAKADQQNPGYFSVLEDLAFVYRLSEDEKHYVDAKGRIFYSTNTERTIYKKGKYKGSEQYSDFGENYQEKQVVIPYSYSEILQTWNGVHFLAKGKNKKWGMISAFNDTLFPFKYDELNFTTKEQPFPIEFPYRDYDEQCYTRSGSLHGILSLNLRKEIPPLYDRVTYVPQTAFVVSKGGKLGVYDYYLKEQIQPVFDELFIASSIAGVYVLRAKKGNKWYNMEFFEGKVPDQTTFLQAPTFELVINETGFVKTENGYELRDLNNVPIKEKTISDYLDSTLFRVTDGKIYLIDQKGKVLYPEGLTNIAILEDGRVISSEKGVTYAYWTWKKNKEIYAE